MPRPSCSRPGSPDPSGTSSATRTGWLGSTASPSVWVTARGVEHAASAPIPVTRASAPSARRNEERVVSIGVFPGFCCRLHAVRACGALRRDPWIVKVSMPPDPDPDDDVAGESLITQEPAGPLAAGLYLVATPIGNARDITLRALDVLAGADILAAEDTRHTRRLLDIHGLRRAQKSFVPYHDHNGAAQRPRLLAAMAEGRSVALVSDAGTPLLADPGWRLAAEAVAAGHPVTAVPGASALLA